MVEVRAGWPGGTMAQAAILTLTALLEIAGCFAFWAFLRQGASHLWIAPGIACLVGFASLLTLVEVDHAGRAYAAYGGIYIAASLVWLIALEGIRPDRWDLIGGAISIAGALVILLGPRAAG